MEFEYYPKNESKRPHKGGHGPYETTLNDVVIRVDEIGNVHIPFDFEHSKTPYSGVLMIKASELCDILTKQVLTLQERTISSFPSDVPSPFQKDTEDNG